MISSGQPPGRSRSRLFSRGLLIVSMVIGFLLSEIFLRFSGFHDPFFYAYDRDLGVKLAAGSRGVYTREGRAEVSINSAGFRDREHTREKPAQTYRIAVLGDSYAEAFQVPLESAFWAVLETLSNEHNRAAHRRFEVLNFGVSGYGTAQELLLLRQYATAYAPDLVLLLVCTGNDLRNNSQTLESRTARPFFSLREGTLTLDQAYRQSWRDHLRTRLLWPLIRVSRVAQLIRKAAETWGAAGQSVEVDVGAERGLDPAVYRPPSDAAWEDAWNITEALLQAIQDETERIGAKLLVVTGSNGIQAHPDAAVRQRFQDRLGVEDLFYPDRRIAAFGERQQIAVLNLAPIFLHYAEQHAVFLHGFANTSPGAGHWNEAGHALAARSIAEYLKTHLMLPIDE